jgi:hypothetical protein
MRCYHEETFGPVVALTAVRNVDEAIRLANDTVYGLSAAIITGDPERGMALAERIHCGMVRQRLDRTTSPTPRSAASRPRGSAVTAAGPPSRPSPISAG